MGINFIYVNPVKRQYIDPDLLLENSKSMGYLTAALSQRCLGILCCRNVAGIATFWEWSGRWFGDGVYAVGDGSTEPEIPELEGEEGAWSLIHQQFDDISYHLLADLCNADPGLAARLAESTNDALNSGIEHLGNVVNLAGCEPLRAALLETHGDRWTEIYCKRYRESSSARRGALRFKAGIG
ncbi:hypothetical protein [Singulisphaera sp. PoT]|uniref:hypothetical protein n=1 Tax=Singulisphaera sp. PoT TaxID=3411797 RepID=UPI003BF55629